jgi:hypothetical protein
MYTTITKFPVPAGAEPAMLRSAFSEVAPLFQETAGLLSKSFLLSEDGTYAGGVYLWESRKHAEEFEPRVREMIMENLGVDPEITYFETPVVVDNQQKKILQAAQV